VSGFRVYASEHAHSSIDKAMIVLGLGHENLRRIRADSELAMSVDALAAAIREDRRAGIEPLTVVATIGTTSTAAVDPVPAIADVCEREGVWFHVDAAYAGAAAILPECRALFEGIDRADSLIVNPHKWLFTPFDLSVLYCRRMNVLRAAFALTPEYLRTPEADEVRNLMDTGFQLGRRFRALKLWVVLRTFGLEGLRARLREHMRLARLLADWIDEDPLFERVAPVAFGVVCFRMAAPADDEINARLLDALNETGDVFLSHTVIEGRYVLRFAIGNIRTTEADVRQAWDLLKSTALSLTESRLAARR
jgi:aromatic-L-amino-acid decarboxylase